MYLFTVDFFSTKKIPFTAILIRQLWYFEFLKKLFSIVLGIYWVNRQKYRHTACECLYWYKYISSTCLSNASHPWHGSSIFLGNKPRLSSLLRGVGICAKFHPQVSYMFTLTFGAGAAAPSFNGKCRGFFLYKRILSLLFLYMMMYKVTAWKTGMLKSQNLFQKPGDTISDFFVLMKMFLFSWLVASFQSDKSQFTSYCGINAILLYLFDDIRITPGPKALFKQKSNPEKRLPWWSTPYHRGLKSPFIQILPWRRAELDPLPPPNKSQGTSKKIPKIFSHDTGLNPFYGNFLFIR